MERTERRNAAGRRKLNPPSGSEESESLLSSPFLELISSGVVVAHVSSRFFFGRPIWLAAKKFVATISLRRVIQLVQGGEREGKSGVVCLRPIAGSELGNALSPQSPAGVWSEVTEMACCESGNEMGWERRAGVWSVVGYGDGKFWIGY
ncbi:unnamed protein product [Linum trigynum]|uniref:Uncharacterized protein n=1 Tax=Linum trigynum TaxID=586398 RepID=A0AAV2DE95_9ROSI